MNPRERLLATMRRQPHDRVPLMLHEFTFPSRKALDKASDPGLREIAERIYDRTAHRVSHPTHVNRWLATPSQFIERVDVRKTDEKATTTSRLRTPKGDLTAVVETNRLTNTNWTVKYPVESLEDVEKIRSIPWERPKGLKAPDDSAMKDADLAKCVLGAGVSSPFVCVGGMTTYERFLELCATHFDLIAELTEECTRRVLDVMDVVLSTRRIEYVWIGGCEWLTPPMGSPRHYEVLVQSPERRLIERCHAAGAVVHVHCHGKVRSTLELAVRRGADYFEPMEPPPDGDITMAEAKKAVAGRMVVGGNVEARLIANESADVVERAARAAFEGGKEHMVLSDTAGPISNLTPRMRENYHRIVDVWEELSAI